MNRLSLPVWLVLVIAAGFCMFQIKFAVQELEHQLGQTNRDIQRAQDQIRVLKAEWSYLNEPGRLSDLNRRHLGLALPRNPPFRPIQRPAILARGGPGHQSCTV